MDIKFVIIYDKYLGAALLPLYRFLELDYFNHTIISIVLFILPRKIVILRGVQVPIGEAVTPDNELLELFCGGGVEISGWNGIRISGGVGRLQSDVAPAPLFVDKLGPISNGIGSMVLLFEFKTDFSARPFLFFAVAGEVLDSPMTNRVLVVS